MPAHRFSCWRRIATALILLLTSVQAVAGAPPAQDEVVAPVEPLVLQQIASEGQATYWVILEEQADLSAAYAISDWAERGAYVYETLTQHATATQAGVLAELTAHGVSHRSFWILNAIQVTSGEGTLTFLRRQPEVKEILSRRVFEIPQPLPSKPQAEVDSAEWNIERVNAPQVWTAFGTKGEGIVVANIDTGVQYDHPALMRQYRGNQGSGRFDHNYNWYDPSLICGAPSQIPCDNVGHGTHTMGIMAGDDGGANQIGVAPGVRWIAAKGCEEMGCTDNALTAAAQWIVAPTDLSGANPRPDLRPHVVNNSWGGGDSDPWYQAFVRAWRAAGIFPAFSAGNDGPNCGTTRSPGDYPESYASGAFGSGGEIAWFSSRGPGGFGEMKPNIAAPGADIRSSTPYRSYSTYSGTSMASPHTAGVVALMWSVAPGLVGDIDGTIGILDDSAVDTEDLQCGGDAGDNNVWGEGRLDAYAAVSQSPQGPVGALEGTVTALAGEFPLEGVQVEVAGEVTRRTRTDAAGFYRFRGLAVGSYKVTASKFTYVTRTVADVTVGEGATTVQDFKLSLAPSYSLAGHIYDTAGAPAAGASVTILNTPIPAATTGADGAYSFPSVPEGAYDVQASGARCFAPQTQQVTLAGSLTGFDFALPSRTDEFGYYCTSETPAYIEADNALALFGDDASVEVVLPFDFPFYGMTYDRMWVSTNGLLDFESYDATYWNGSIPSPESPNAAVYAHWDDLEVNAEASVNTKHLADVSPRAFVVEWRNVNPLATPSLRMDFEIILFEDGDILTQYRHIDDQPNEKGASATIGIEDENGAIAFQYAFNEPAINHPEDAIRYRLLPMARVRGTVTDANDGLPIAGAVVRATQEGPATREARTDADGSYELQVPLGMAAIAASKPDYSALEATIALEDEDVIYTQDFALPTPRAEVAPDALNVIAPAGRTVTATLALHNTGSLPLTWEIMESGLSAPMSALAAPLAASTAQGIAPDARTTRGAATPARPAMEPTEAGDVLASWSPSGMSLAWGVGYDGDVWLSDAYAIVDKEFDEEGSPTGVQWPANFGGSWPGDMAYDAGRGWMCQINVGGNNGIYCWDPATGAVRGSITGAFSWTYISQRGLAYRPDDDSFYAGGWNEGILFHIAGFSHPEPGSVLDQCNPPDYAISGLAWNPARRLVWEATNNLNDVLYALDPDTCNVVATMAHPDPYFNGGGLEMDAAGNLWMVGLDPNRIYLVDSGMPSFVDVPWISEAPASGVLQPGARQTVAVGVDATSLDPGVYAAQLVIRTNSGRRAEVIVPVQVSVLEDTPQVQWYFPFVPKDGSP